MDSTRATALAVAVILVAVGIRGPIPLEALPVALLALAGIIAVAGLIRFLGYPWLTARLADRRRQPRVREIWVPRREPSSTFTGVLDMEEDTTEVTVTSENVLQLPPTSGRRCVVCGTDMHGRKSNARFCSAKCRKVGWKEKREMG